MAYDSAPEEWQRKAIEQGERLIRRKVADGTLSQDDGEARIRELRAKIMNTGPGEIDRRRQEAVARKSQLFEVLRSRVYQIPQARFLEVIAILKNDSTAGKESAVMMMRRHEAHCLVLDGVHYPAASVISWALFKCAFDDVPRAAAASSKDIAAAGIDIVDVLAKARFQVVACGRAGGSTEEK